MDLFEYMREQSKDDDAPLASRMRPRTLDEVVGQEHIVGKNRLLYRAIQADKLSSVIFYGPPGTGKTTLAKVIANTTSSRFCQINATVAGKKDMEDIVKEAKDALGMYGKKTILFVDEIHRLNRQVEELTSGAIPGKAMSTSLSIGVAVSIGLAMLRVLTGVSIFVLLVPGYLCAIGLSFVVPKIFTAIAFDSGGVASGPMTATFLLPFAMGACETLGGNVVTDAFGVVAMVAMTPLITIQLLGLVYQLKLKKAAAEAPAAPAPEMPAADDEIIEL